MTLTVKQGRLDIPPTKKEGKPSLVSFLKGLMRRRRRLPTQLAKDLGLSHPTVTRWISGEDVPSTSSCRKLAEYSGVPLEKVFSMAGHLPKVTETAPTEWPEFREYAQRKYPTELDEDMVTMIEDLIERRRARVNGRRKS